MDNAWHFSSIIRLILKFLGVLITIVLLLFGIVYWIVFKKKDDWVLDKIQT